MTVSSTNTKNSYSGDGSTTVFAYTFKIFDDDDITVILRTDATGTETVQTKTTHYSVSGVGSAGGGNITFVSAPASGVTVVLLRETAQTQTTDYTPNDPFPAASHEDALDKLTLIVQDIQEETDRSIKLSRTNTMTSTEFTVGASTRANKILAFDGSGELSVTQELGTFQGNWAASTAYYVRDIIKDTSNNNIYICNTAHTSSGSQPISTNTDSAKWDLLVDAASATTSATAAAASATAAAASETAAAASESAAATSESNAATSASSASTSASNASTSATNAASSATAAAASATAASASETAAAASESAAATSETNAATSASSASTSATNAATSATNASNSASAASTSASNAATSESNASTSETNAASSASSAASDASAAAASAAAAAASFDAFDDIYLGAKASAPTVDNDGDALTAGDQYFNTTNNTLYVWNGSAWQAATPDIVGDTTPQLGGNLDTNGNDITFGDNDKATFGDAVGGDLRIYHNATDSIIEDQGSGNLVIRGTNLRLQDSAGTNYLYADTGGAVTILHGGSNKLATTASGVSITGSLDADGLTVDGTVDINGNYLEIGDGTATAQVAIIAGTTGNSTLDFGDSADANIGRIEYEHTNDALTFRTNNSERLRITSGGNVGIGGVPVVSSSSYNSASMHLRQASGTTAGGQLRFTTGASGHTATDGAFISYFTDNNMYYNNQESGAHKFYTAGSERMTITSGGSVGIGQTSPTGKLHVEGNTNGIINGKVVNTNTGVSARADFSVVSDSADLTILAASAAYTGVSGWADTGIITTSSSTSGGMLFNVQASAPYRFMQGSTNERMRVDTSGNLLVGKTTADGAATAGSELRPDGTIRCARANTIGVFNRLTTDGNIIEFEKDGSTVGSIGTNSSDLVVHSSPAGHSGLRFGNGYIIPTDNTGSTASSDNSFDLGVTGTRFKDLYLSGGVYVGGTGASNLLDDYEEGTFTPAYQSVSGGSWTYSTQTGYYTKVGNMVHVHGQITTSAGSGLTGTIQINLPFASVQNTPGPILVDNLNKTTDADIVTLTVSSNLRVYEFRNNTVYTTRDYADLGSAHSIFFNVTYRV